MVAEPARMTPAAYAVLGAISQVPTHGFAIARRLQPAGDLGQVWSVTRPLVYRELARLIEHDLVREESDELGDRGPRRTVVRITGTGRAAIDWWLAEPVDRVRDFRSMFLLKLALIDGAGGDPAPLARAQRAVFEQRLEQMQREVATSTGFDARVALWRALSTRAAVEFLIALDSDAAR